MTIHKPETHQVLNIPSDKELKAKRFKNRAELKAILVEIGINEDEVVFSRGKAYLNISRPGMGTVESDNVISIFPTSGREHPKNCTFRFKETAVHFLGRLRDGLPLVDEMITDSLSDEPSGYFGLEDASDVDTDRGETFDPAAFEEDDSSDEVPLDELSGPEETIPENNPSYLGQLLSFGKRAIKNVMGEND